MEASLRFAFAAGSGLIVGLIAYGLLPYVGPALGLMTGLVVAGVAFVLPRLAAREEHSEPEIRHASAPRRMTRPSTRIG